MERIPTLLLFLSAACTPLRLPENPHDLPDLAFTHVNVVDVEKGQVHEGQTVLIAGSRIVRVGPSASLRTVPGTRVVDGRGKYLIPGLIDSHVHADLTKLDPTPLPSFRWFLANGVTAVREASGAGREKTFVEVREKAERGEILFPRFYVSGTASARNVERHAAVDMRDLTRRLIAIGVDGIKTFQLTREETLAVLEEAQQADVPVYGHTYVAGGLGMGRSDLSLGYDNYTLDAVRAGLSGVMHIESASPAASRMPRPPTLQAQPDNVVEWHLHWLTRWLHATDDEIQELLDVLVGHDAWLEPTLVPYDVMANPDRYRGHPGEAVYGTSIADFWGVPTLQETDPQRLRARVLERAKEFVRRFHEAGGLVIVGSDSAPLPGWGTHEEMRLLVEAGLSPLAALQAATINAARALRWQARIGTIEEGKFADLVLLEADPLEDIRNAQRIAAVVLNGRYLDRQALDQLLIGAEPMTPFTK